MACTPVVDVRERLDALSARAVGRARTARDPVDEQHAAGDHRVPGRAVAVRVEVDAGTQTAAAALLQATSLSFLVVAARSACSLS